jgi:transposase
MTTTQKRRRVYLDDVDHFLGFGWSIDQIAKRLGVEAESVKQALRRRDKRTAEQPHPAEQQRPAA